MKNKHFNEREKRLFNYFSKKDHFYKGYYFGETNPIIDRKINEIKKRIVSNLKKQLKKTNDKCEQKMLLEFLKPDEKPIVNIEKNQEGIDVPAVIEEKVVKKVEVKVKDPLIFKTELYRKDYSKYVYWCDPYEPVNKGRLGSTQEFKKKKKYPTYY